MLYYRVDSQRIQNDRMYPPNSEQGPIIGEGYGLEERRKHLWEAYQRMEPKTKEEIKVDPGHPLFGHINPIGLLKMFVEKSQGPGNCKIN